MPAAVAWWNLLQDQFRQAVASAMPPEGASPDKPGAAADGAGAPPAAGKPAATETGDGGHEHGNGNPAHARRNTRSKADKA